MKKIISLIFLFFSSSIFSNENLIGKNFLCLDLLWGFEFISSDKVLVIKTNLNNETYIREYYFETDSKFKYINIFSIENAERNLIYSIHENTLRVDVWTMTSGGNTKREIIPSGFCGITDITNIFDYIQKLKRQ